MTVEQINSEGKALYLHHDQQGSTRLLTSSTGAKEATFTYDAYGNRTGSTGTATTPLGYDGQYTNGDGLIYLRARAYDPATAQFVSVDPIAPITRAPYNYTNDNPVNAVDPTGLFSWEDISKAAAGALDALTFGGSTQLAGKIFGFNADCASFGTAGEIGAGLALGVGLFYGETEAELAAEGAGTVVRGGETAAAAAYGRAIHAAYDYGPGFETEVTLANGQRADAVNLATREVVELKPNNPAAIARGERQAAGYAQQLDHQYPGTPFTYRVQAYDQP